MMTHGIDMIELHRIQRLMNKETFIHRVYTPGERSLLNGRSEHRKVELLAGRFAAKEAAYKALMFLISESELFIEQRDRLKKSVLTWQDFETLQNAEGMPILLFHRAAETWISQCQVTSRLVSLSHTREHALASVILC